MPATLKRHGTLSPQEWAEEIVAADRRLHVHQTPRQVAEGVGVVESESAGNADNLAQGPEGHIGGWSESPFYGSEAERLDPFLSTVAAIKDWVSRSPHNYWHSWGRYETGEAEGAGPTRYPKYLGVARAALGGKATAPVRASTGASSPRPSSPSSSAGPDFLRFGVVALLVVGGVVFVALGTTKLAGGRDA